MTTPAVNLSNLTYLPHHFYYNGVEVSVNGQLAVVDKRERPASVSSPMREDFTRAPTSWRHKWWRHHVPRAKLTYDGSSPGYVSEPFPIAASDPGSNVGALIPIFDPGLEQRIWQGALSRVKNQHVDLGVTLAEAGQIAEQVSETAHKFASGITNLYKSLKPGGMQELGDAFKKLSKDRKAWSNGGLAVINEYLGFCYGWQPTVSDIKGSLRTLAERMNQGQRPQFTVSYKAKDTTPYEWLRDNRTVYEYGIGTATFEGKVTLCYLTSVPNADLATQLGGTNPLSTAYELIPYSFVLDWMWPIGDWINTFDASVGKRFKEGSFSRKVSVDVKPRIDPYWVGDKVQMIEIGRLVGGTFERMILSELPLLIPPPQLRNPLSLGNVAKGLALATRAVASFYSALPPGSVPPARIPRLRI